MLLRNAERIARSPLFSQKAQSLTFVVKHSTAFTLLETMVPMAVLFVLGAMVLIGVDQVTERSRTATCITNIRNVGMAFTSYTQENNGRFPALTTTYYFDTSGYDPALFPWLGSKLARNRRNPFYCAYHDEAKLAQINPSYEVNTRLSGMSVLAVAKPSAATMLLCGAHRKIPAQQNNVPICHVDGHVEIGHAPRDADDWKTLRNQGFAN